MHTHSLPRPWQTLLARAIRLFDKIAVSYSSYAPPEEVIIVSREVKKVPHYRTQEMTVADVVQGQRFCSKTFHGEHGSIIEIKDLHYLLITRIVLLFGKIENGLKPMAIKPDNEYQVDRIINLAERETQTFLNNITMLLHDEGVLVESPPFPKLLDQQRKAS